MRYLVLICLFLVSPVWAQSQELAAPLVDEAEAVPDFLAFRTELIEAVVARDVNAIMDMTVDDLKFGFGGSQDRNGLRAFLDVDAAAFSPEQQHELPAMRERNWDELETVLRLGGVFEADGTFIAPYTWAAPKPADIDPFDVMFITGDGVALRDRPIRFGSVLTRLNFDVVTFRNWVTGTQFVEVEMADGVTGFVHRDYARFLVDYRAVFAKRDGTWQMTHFIAGADTESELQ